MDDETVIPHQEQAKVLPPAEEFFFKVPLYETFTIDPSNFNEMVGIQFYAGTMDAYCIECAHQSIFKDVADYRNYTEEYALRDRIFSVTLECTRNKDHQIYFIFRVQNKTVSKIGQSPSIADFYSPDIGKYRKILGDEKYRELKRAIGLVSHGVGIGAFVYLRRIFENLIEEEHQEAKKLSEWDEEKYSKSRMDEKILLLQGSLPDFLVQNRGLYSILSKGIHYLTEQECLNFFDPVRLGIEMILDERIEQKQKQDKISLAKKIISDIETKLT